MSNSMTLTFRLHNQLLCRTDSHKPVEKSVGYLHLKFDLDESWDFTDKVYAVIDYNDTFYNLELDEEHDCIVPSYLVKAEGFYVNLVGFSNDNSIKITTTQLFVPIRRTGGVDVGPNPVVNIESDTLDVEREGDTAHIEMPADIVNLTEEDIDEIAREVYGDD